MVEENIQKGDIVKVKNGVDIGDITAPSAKVDKRKLLDNDSLVNIHGETFKVEEVQDDKILLKDRDKGILQKLNLKSDKFVLNKKYVKKI